MKKHSNPITLLVILYKLGIISYNEFYVIQIKYILNQRLIIT